MPGAGPGKKVAAMREDGLLEYLIVEEYTPEILGENTGNPGSARHAQDFARGARAFCGERGGMRDGLYQNVWVRDNVLVANSFRLRGEQAPAVACMQGLNAIFATQRARFLGIINDASRRLKEDVQRRPHIRFAPKRWANSRKSGRTRKTTRWARRCGCDSFSRTRVHFR